MTKEEIVIESDEEETFEGENEINEEEESEEESEDGEFEEDVSLADLFQTFFAGENNKNVVDTLDDIKKSIDVQNKILNKMCNTLLTMNGKKP